MPFQIPSLEEARRKQERQAAEALMPSSFRSRRSNGAALANAQTSASAGGGSRGAPTCAGRKRPIPAAAAKMARAATAEMARAATAVANPYTRKNPYLKRPRDAPLAASSSAGGSSRNSTGAGATSAPPPPPPPGSNPYGGGDGGPSRSQNSVREPRTLPVPPPSPVIADVGPGATFSQAFDSVEDTSHYRSEAAAAASGDADAEGRRLRAEQRAFDASIASEVEAAAEDDDGTGALSQLRRQQQPKDDRAVLQPHVLHVSNRQRGNPLLRLIRNVPYGHANIVPDYVMGPNRCALFLSIKYHNLHPNYIHRRIAELGRDFDLRVLLVKVDVEDNAATLLQLNKLAVVNDLTLILAWSDEEAARYLETFKAFEGKDASSIQKREQTNYADRVTDVLCTVRSVNKTDAAQLLGQFGSLKALVGAGIDEMSLCPGIGEKKVRRLWEAFHRPFSTAAVRKKRRLEKEAEEKRSSAAEEEDEIDNGEYDEEDKLDEKLGGREGDATDDATRDDDVK